MPTLTPTAFTEQTPVAIAPELSIGIRYTGQLSPRLDVKVYQASLVEACSTGIQTFSGVATHRPAAGNTPPALTLVVVSTDETESAALAVLLNKN